MQKNTGDVRGDLALMIAREPLYAKIYEYAETSIQLTTRDEILSSMVVYGFLSGEQSKVFIPNKFSIFQKTNSLKFF